MDIATSYKDSNGHSMMVFLQMVSQCLLTGMCIAYFGTSAVRSDEYKLIHDLFRNYDPYVRPRYHSNETVYVAVRFSLQQIYDLDEKRQILTISGWLTAEWKDDFLTWDPSDYGGMTSFVISPLKMWIPFLAIGNSANKMFQDWKYFSVTVRFDGSCRWQPGGNFALTCRLDMNYYPFDKQTCTMEVETWFFSSDKVELIQSLDKFGLETYLKHGEWAIQDTEVTKVPKVYSDLLDEEYAEVYFTLYLKRKYTFHFMYILLPCIMLSFVLLMIFLLPAQSGEKVSLGVSILVAFSVFLLIVADQVPDTSDAVPVMAIYLMYFMMTTAVSVITSTIVIKIHYNGSDVAPPRWLTVLSFDLIAPLVCLKSVVNWANYHRKCLHTRDKHSHINHNSHYSLDNMKELASKVIKSNGLATSNSNLLGNNVCMMSRTLSIDLPPDIHSYDDVPESNEPREEFAGEELVPFSCVLTKSQYVAEKWKKVAEVIDRMLFWLFFLFLLVALTSLIGFMHYF